MHKFQLFAIAALLVAGQSYAGVLDFEEAASLGGDDAAISSDYLASQGYSFTAVAGTSASTATSSGFAFEAVGQDGTDAFWTSTAPNRDNAVAGDMGNYFAKSDQGPTDYFKLTVDYAELSTSVSGEIWDIDNNDRFQVTAFDASGNQIQTLTTPETSWLDARPWAFSIDADPNSGQLIDRIEIESVAGYSAGAFGLDNFSYTPSTASTHAAPLPGALPLAFAGFTAMVASRRRKKTDNIDTPEDTVN